MKTSKLFVLILLSVLVASCQNEDDVFDVNQNVKIEASIEQPGKTRTSLSGTQVLWGEGDALKVFVGAATAANKFVLSDEQGDGQGIGYTNALFDAEGRFQIGAGIENGSPFANLAYYPYVETLSVAKESDNYVINTALPEEQKYTVESFGPGAFPMVSVADGFNFVFKNVASILKVTLKGEAKIIKATVKSDSKKLAGSCTVTVPVDKIPVVVVDETTGSNMVVLSCGAGVQLNNETGTEFLFVIPPGTYDANDLTLTFYDSSNQYFESKITALNTFKRSEYLNFERVYSVTGKASGVDAANEALSSGSKKVSVIVADTDEKPTLTLPESSSDEPTELSFEAIPSGKKVIIQGESENASVSKSVKISASFEATSSNSFDINLPKSTVTLGANGESAIYNEVTASTAEETLIISQNVTVNSLKIKKGHVIVHGSIGDILREGTENGDVTYIIKEESANITGTVGEGCVVVSAAEYNLRKAIKNNNEVVLNSNVTLTDAITINKAVTVDLNGYTIENKSANNTTKLGDVADECIVFYVDGAEANLTLNATNGGKVIAAGDGSTSYYNVAVWVTNGATTTINGGEYTNTADPEGDGCDLIYGRDGGKIFVTGGTFKAGAIRSDLGGGIYGVLNCKDTKGSTITVSGGKFYEYGATEAAKVGNGEVILLEPNYYWSAKDTEGYYTVTDEIETEEALRTAITNTDNVKLGANITLTDAITINKAVTIDLNGYTIENKSANNTTKLGDVADECIVFYVDGAEANLTLNATNGGKVIATGDGSTSYYNVAVWVTNGATTTINGGEYSNTADPNNDGCDLIYGRDGGKIFVTGGTFKAGAIRSDLGGGIYGVLNCKDTKGSTITVSGGKFYEYGAAEAAKVGNGEVVLLEPGYEWSEKDNENYYSVVPVND